MNWWSKADIKSWNLQTGRVEGIEDVSVWSLHSKEEWLELTETSFMQNLSSAKKAWESKVNRLIKNTLFKSFCCKIIFFSLWTVMKLLKFSFKTLKLNILYIKIYSQKKLWWIACTTAINKYLVFIIPFRLNINFYIHYIQSGKHWKVYW